MQKPSQLTSSYYSCTLVQRKLEEYYHTLSSNFKYKYAALLQYLTDYVSHLKQYIVKLKGLTSEYRIAKLLGELREKKYIERQQLESMWRGLTYKYQKLQIEEKKLIDENIYRYFDLETLRRKLKQFQITNAYLEKNVKRLESEKDGQFITIVKVDESRCRKVENDLMKHSASRIGNKKSAINRLIAEQKANFFSYKYRINKKEIETDVTVIKTHKYNKTNKGDKYNHEMILFRPARRIQKVILTRKDDSPLKTTNLTCETQRIQNRYYKANHSAITTQRQLLLAYISDPLIRYKIFQFLHKP